MYGAGRARWTFTARTGGVSPAPWDSLNLADHVGDDPGRVLANRGRAADVVGASGVRLAVISAEHGARVAVVSEAGTVSGVDALVTTRPGLGLLALAADCIPIVLVDPVAEVVAAVHSGWRGVVAGVVPAAVARMVEQGAAPPRVRAHLGPSICPKCFQVGDDVADQLQQAVPGTLARTSWGALSVDLPRAVSGQLRACAVVQVEQEQRCTFHDEGLFSYRRDGLTGRHGAVVVLAPAGGDAGWSQ